MNELLRAHVTRVGFDLSLGHTHISALVDVAFSIRNGKRVRSVDYSRVHSMFSHATHGLIERGLVRHHYNEKEALGTNFGKARDKGLGPHYTITPAGKLVVALLKEAGLYDEYASAFFIVSAKTA